MSAVDTPLAILLGRIRTGVAGTFEFPHFDSERLHEILTAPNGGHCVRGWAFVPATRRQFRATGILLPADVRLDAFDCYFICKLERQNGHVVFTEISIAPILIAKNLIALDGGLARTVWLRLGLDNTALGPRIKRLSAMDLASTGANQ